MRHNQVARTGKSRRQDLILAELRIGRTIRVSELAEKFGTSTETIRRDLDEMKAAELLNRTHGGATFVPMGHEPSLFEREQMFLAERERIGAKVVAALSPHDVVMLDNGTTTIEAAKAISVRQTPLTVITNSYVIATILGSNPLVRTIMPPGQFSAADAEVNGLETNEFVRRFNANIFITGASGVTPGGPADNNLTAAHLKRAMVSRAHKTVLIVDHSKFGRYALETVCPWSNIGSVVTDRVPPAAFQEIFELQGVDVVIAEETGAPVSKNAR
jgi:DeoR family glycerol-3-phosphate regulon repressor